MFGLLFWLPFFGFCFFFVLFLGHLGGWGGGGAGGKCHVSERSVVFWRENVLFSFERWYFVGDDA